MSRLRTIAAAAALGAAALALAACSGSSQASLTCPKVVEAPDTSMIALFGPNGHDAKDVMVGGRIRNISFKCQRQRVGVELNTQIEFEAQRANYGITDANLPYFVALLDPDQNLVKEEGFNTHFNFLPGELDRRVPPEDITIDVPVKDTSTGGAYTVVVEFRLTPDQLAFNRTTQQ